MKRGIIYGFDGRSTPNVDKRCRLPCISQITVCHFNFQKSTH